MPLDRLMIADIVIVSAVWLVLSILFSGLGAAVRRMYRTRISERNYLFLDWWMGWTLCVVFLLVWHLLLPVNAWAYLPLAVGGAIGASMAWNDWIAALRSAQRERGWLAALVILAWVGVAAQTLGLERQYDTALYHLQSVLWAQAYAVVPGLANIHSRFATNSSFFVFAALVDQVEIAGRSLRMAAGLLFFPLIVQGIVTAHGALTGRREMDLSGWFQVLMLPVLLWQSRGYASGLSPDGVVFILAVVVSGEFLRLLARESAAPAERPPSVDWEYSVFAIIVLTAIGVTIKLSFVFLGIATIAAALWVVTRERTRGRIAKATRISVVLVRGAVVSIVIAALWMAHGVIISGYIAYPSSVGSFPVEWRLPTAVVKHDADWIVAWARHANLRWSVQMAGDYPWFQRWIADVSRDRDVIGVTVALLVAAGLYLSRRRDGRTPAAALPKLSTFLLPSLLAVTAWFATAPAIRFVIGPLWVIAVATVAWTVARTSEPLPSDSRWSQSTFALLLSMLAAALGIGIHESVVARPSFAVKPVTTRSGLTIYTPVLDDRCGYAPLPCSNVQPNERLELRRPGSMGKGFRLAK